MNCKPLGILQHLSDWGNFCVLFLVVHINSYDLVQFSVLKLYILLSSVTLIILKYTFESFSDYAVAMAPAVESVVFEMTCVCVC